MAVIERMKRDSKARFFLGIANPNLGDLWAMSFCKPLSCVMLIGLFLAPPCVSGEALDIHRFQLVSVGSEFTLHSSDGQSVPVPREWLMPAQQVREEESTYVSSFDYSKPVTAFRVTNELIGLHLSSYQIQKEGSARAAAGRDVFLLFDPQRQELHEGLMDLGVTKRRIRFMGCARAYHHDFTLEDINGDYRTDIGVKKDEIRCDLVHNEIEDVDYFVSKEASHEWRWFVLEGDQWRYSASHDGRAPSASSVELPFIDMLKSPVDFVREMTSPIDR
ncbi:MAG: hypothetical protein AAF604_02590 [Acidobacteriota bacterium]